MSTGKANGGERDAALAGRVMECIGDRAGRGRSRGATDSDGDDAPGRGGMVCSQTRGTAAV
jgi:hypothetical protein